MKPRLKHRGSDIVLSVRMEQWWNNDEQGKTEENLINLLNYHLSIKNLT
jgi:hypothetical protein